MNILITGSNGQLGNEMRVLSKKYDRYTCFFTDIEDLDICDEQAVVTYIADNRIDIVVNCAAYTAVDNAEDNKELSDKLNNIAAGYLARAAQSRKATMIQISTDYVFDGTKHTPYTEKDTPCPASVYGATKLAGEENVLKHCEKAVIIRTSWLYSTYGNNFVKTMIRLGRERNKIGVIFDQTGTPTYAYDLAQIIYLLIDKGVVSGIYHFSNEGVCSWYDFAVSIHRLAGVTGCKVEPLHTVDYPTKAARPYYSVLDKTKIKETYGLEIPHWEKSLEQMISKINANKL